MNSKLLLWFYDRGRRDFSGKDLQKANLQRSNLRFVCLSRSKLQGANFSHSLLIGADFVHTYLQGAQFVNANCLGSNFLAANLRRANLSRATLSGSIFNGANLSQADLSDAALTGAELRAVNLQGANLSGANLSGANLRAANLFRADLTGANLEGADLSGAIMPDAEPDTLPVNETLYTPPPQSPRSPLPPRRAADHNNPWSGEISPAFEAIAIKVDPHHKSATQKALDAEWGATSADGSVSDQEATIAKDSLGRWQALLHEGLARTFQFKDEEEAQGRLNRSMLLRKGQPQLRIKLLQAYDRRCAMSRCTVEDVLEAAYIVPFLGDQTNEPNNLLLLRSDLHVLFDLHLIAIDPTHLTIRLAPWLKDTYYSILEGRSLHLPLNEEMRPNRQLLIRHWEQCKWEREGAWPTSYIM